MNDYYNNDSDSKSKFTSTNNEKKQDIGSKTSGSKQNNMDSDDY